MITFLFWNLNRKPLAEVVWRLAQEHSVDVLMLAECSQSSGEILEILNRENAGYQLPFSNSEKISVFTRFRAQHLESRLETTRWTIRQLLLPGTLDILLVVVHFPDKRNWSGESLAALAEKLSQDIRDAESYVGHSRTIVVGDFNMNPFESGMVKANGLHAVATRRTASAGARVVMEQRYPFFYNPMWNLMGDFTTGPAGTYHYRNSEMLCYFWNMFDQVLVRPELLNYFQNENLAILQTSGSQSFLTATTGIPDRIKLSDHLPIVFKLSL